MHAWPEHGLDDSVIFDSVQGQYYTSWICACMMHMARTNGLDDPVIFDSSAGSILHAYMLEYECMYMHLSRVLA